MRVEFDDSLFVSPETRSRKLVGLIECADRHNHVVVADAQIVEQWVGSLSTELAESLWLLLDNHRTRAASLSANTLCVRIHADASMWTPPRPSLHVDEAWVFLPHPLELLLENEDSDWSFIRRLAIQAQRDLLDDAVARRTLQIRNGGGITGVKKQVDALFQLSDNHTLNVSRRLRRLRTWVMFDRDADTNDAREPSSHAIDAKRSCEQVHTTEVDPWQISYRRLSRRHIECYLPNSSLAGWAKEKRRTPADSARAAALEQLRENNPDWAGCLHMKEGLMKDLLKVRTRDKAFVKDASSDDGAQRRTAEARVQPNEWIPPFDQLASEVRADLLSGFGGKISSVFSTAPSRHDHDFRAEFNRGQPDDQAAQLIESILDRI